MLETGEIEHVEDEPKPQVNFSGHGANLVSPICAVSSIKKKSSTFENYRFTFLEANANEDILTVDGRVCAMFREVCSKRGLMSDDEVWNCTLREFLRYRFVHFFESFAMVFAIFCPLEAFLLWIE